ncbi:MAG: hypothetical protein WDN28_27120 [Chthoniobacter sp.]
MPLFLVALLVTEFGHWLFIVPLFIALLPSPRTPLNHFATALALVSSVLLLSSAIRANALARRLPQELAHAFPETTGTAAEPLTPFSWKKLWHAPKVEPVAVEKYEYASHADEALHLLLYRAGETHPVPCVIVVHGGGWINGAATENATFSPLSRPGADMRWRPSNTDSPRAGRGRPSATTCWMRSTI